MTRLTLRIAFLSATLSLVLAAAAAAASGPDLKVGGMAPDFTLQDVDGKPVTLSKLLEKGPVLLDFWALWCKPCLQALPGTDALSTKYADRGLTVLAVNTDQPRSTAKVRSYVKSSGFHFTVPLDPNSDMLRLYRFSKIPQVFLVAQDGSIAFSKLGYAPGQEKAVEQEIEKLLAGTPDAKTPEPAESPGEKE
jgi:peroxiredoxin